MISQDNKSGLRNPWVLGMLALIVVVLCVNATFIWFTNERRLARRWLIATTRPRIANRARSW